MTHLGNIQRSLDSIESVYMKDAHNFEKIKENADLASKVEKDLFSRQADLKLLKFSYQNFSSLADSFSRDLHNYCAKLKDSTRVKHLSSDLQTDLSLLKECLSEAENKYQTLFNRLKLSKDILSSLIENQRQLNSSCDKLSMWLDDVEKKFEQDSKYITDVTDYNKLNQRNQVKALEEASAKLQVYTNDIQLQHRLVDEIDKSLQLLLSKQLKHAEQSCKETFIHKVSSLNSRYKHLEKSITDKNDFFFACLTKARNLKENVDSTNSWLSQINVESLATSSDIEKIRSELDSRKEALTKNLSSNDYNAKRVVEQLIDKIDFLSDKIDTKASKAKSLQHFLSKFEENCDKLDNNAKSCANKLESNDALKGII